MFAEPYRVVPVLLFIALVFMTTCFAPGCRKEKDIRRVVAENSCKDIIDSPSVSERTKKLARKALDGWKNKVVDPEPILIQAGHVKKTDKDYWLLFLTMSDEEFDIAGFVIRELHKQSNSDMILVEEDYPIFPMRGIGQFQFVAFMERKTLAQRKDDKAWNNYLNSGVNDRDTAYLRNEYPTIWISLPRAPTVEVEIWIYDFAGNKSEPVPLEYGLAGKGIKKPMAVTGNSAGN